MNKSRNSTVSRDGFSYDGSKFYTQVSCGSRKHQIERADANYLYKLLTRQGPRKDRTPAFYRGQLIHYGVEPSNLKTRKAAKQQLLAAFENSNKKLEIPEHIRQIESELNDRYQAEPVYEVETIRQARWNQGVWDYFVKWYNYDETENSWEPAISLKNCLWTFQRFWLDVGMDNLGGSSSLEDGFTLYSSTSYQERCLTRCQGNLYEPEEADDTGFVGDDLDEISAGADIATTDIIVPDEIEDLESSGTDCSVAGLTYTVPGRLQVAVPHPSLLWAVPEALGLMDLTSDDRYQIVQLSLQTQKVNALQLLYRKAKNDTKEVSLSNVSMDNISFDTKDSNWINGWGNGCMICYNGKPAQGMLACSCRFKAYCMQCLQKLMNDHGNGKEGLVSCPTCREHVYAVSKTWIDRSPGDNRAHQAKKAEKRKRNKDNRMLAKFLRRDDGSRDMTQRK
ncbi:hypothetical protein VNI00_014511 [Paramarasmius palmivorus]|uniref:Chromo domain-containing protein n=1 Tax=Paramarasmius palmivorus TaxID=297713 RepID=A0AAW0BSC6_9AGAR